MIHYSKVQKKQLAFGRHQTEVLQQHKGASCFVDSTGREINNFEDHELDDEYDDQMFDD